MNVGINQSVYRPSYEEDRELEELARQRMARFEQPGSIFRGLLWAAGIELVIFGAVVAFVYFVMLPVWSWLHGLTL